MSLAAKMLNMKQKLINMCYEEWAITMLKHSSKEKMALENEIIEKMDRLRGEIQMKNGNLSSIDYTRIAKIAEKTGKKKIAIELLEYEKSVIKKVRFHYYSIDSILAITWLV
jgi:hypothetical protein